MEQYSVTGMSCAACSARVEKAVNKLDGVTSCSVSLLTNSMGVEGSATSEEIIKAVTDAGYGASLKKSENISNFENGRRTENYINKYEEELKDTQSPKIAKRLIVSIIFLLPLMYVSMGHTMWGWPVPMFLHENHVAIGIYELLFAGIVMVVNQKFFINGFKGLIHKAPNMDTLVALGSTASYLYSIVVLFIMTYAEYIGDKNVVAQYGHEFYFESAAMILTLITIGKLLEAKSKGKTTSALKALMKLSPKTATLIIDGNEEVTPIERVKIGDHFAVKPGENIPVDGFVISGSSAVNEASLTGESIPVDKKSGDEVSAATINQSGYIVCEATRVGEDTTLSQIIQMVSDAAATKAPIAKIADKVSGIFVPVVLLIALATFAIWMIAGSEVGFSLARAISVLVISCPCALGLATPVAIMVGNGMGAKNGIMFKTATSLEETGKINIVALDKTGTITKGEPKVTNIFLAEGVSEEKLIEKAYALESKSEHPLAKAIVKKAIEAEARKLEIDEFQILSGSGIKGKLEGKDLLAGSHELVKNQLFKTKEKEWEDNTIKEVINIEKIDELSNEGHTPLYFMEDGKLLGVITVADTIKEDSTEAIRMLKNMGIYVVMLTGDNEKTANAIGKIAGVNEVVAGVKPDGKEEVIRRLKEFGKVAMVGDGINDAPALTRADIGIAIGAGSDIAIDSADIVLMKNSLLDVAAGIRLSKATLRNIKENLFWAFIYNIIGIPLAAGLWIPIFGWTLNPMFGAAAMSLSSVCVVSNALRLNLFKMYKVKTFKKSIYDGKKLLKVEENVESEEYKENQLKEVIEQTEEKEQKIMEAKYVVNGMMCAHCEAHVKKAVEAIDGVVSVIADHEANQITVEMEKEVAKKDIEAAVVEAGYTMD